MASWAEIGLPRKVCQSAYYTHRQQTAALTVDVKLQEADPHQLVRQTNQIQAANHVTSGWRVPIIPGEALHVDALCTETQTKKHDPLYVYRWTARKMTWLL